MNKQNFYSIMPLLEDEIGHIYAYNLALSKAVEQNGWNHFGFVPKSVKIKRLPPHWQRVLPADSWQKKRTFKKKIKALFLSGFAYRKLFKRAGKENGIVFLEHFTLTHLLALIFASFFLKGKLNLWLLHRYLPSRKKVTVFRFIHKIYATLLGKEKIKLFTDSSLLKRDLQKIFQKEVLLLPIPHNNIRIKPIHKSSNASFLWWPGGVIRESKGLHEVLQIAKDIKNSSYRLILSESMKEYLPSHDHILFIPKELSRSDYEFWMNKADIHHFPYDPIIYSHGTSGIFVEAISCGKTPFVKEDSWLAYELKRYDLQELIIDWNSPKIMDIFFKYLNCPNIQRKLKKMQNDYTSYHCIESFSKVLNPTLNSL